MDSLYTKNCIVHETYMHSDTNLIHQWFVLEIKQMVIFKIFLEDEQCNDTKLLSTHFTSTFEVAMMDIIIIL